MIFAQTVTSTHPGLFAGPRDGTGAGITSERLSAVKELTALLEANRSFSFLRLGDGELRFMVCMQEGTWRDDDFALETRASCESSIRGGVALRAKDYERLLRAYEGCSYLDLYQNQESNLGYFDRLKWKRRKDGWQSRSPETGAIINDWTAYELFGYLSNHNCLICGGEAALQESLLSFPEYRRLAASFWPANGNVSFLYPSEGGKNLSANLDRIKAILVKKIRKEGADTILLSLGGIAKILCYEIAEEENIRAIDWGSMLRALTYSGSDGHATWRADHNPFFFRIPLDLYLRALQKSEPDLSTVRLFAKAHAQLCLELQRKEFARSTPCDLRDARSFSKTDDNLRHFCESLRYYRKRILPLAQNDYDAAHQAREFERWCLKKGIGLRGWVFLKLVSLKKFLRLLFEAVGFKH